MPFSSVKLLLLFAGLPVYFTANAFSLPADSSLNHTQPKPGHRKGATETKFAGHITQKSLHDRLAILTSDAFEGRETGTRGARKAQQYIAEQFKSFGLLPPVKGSYFFDVPLIRKQYKEADIMLADQQFPKSSISYLPSRNIQGSLLNTSRILIIHAPQSADSLEKELGSLNLTGKTILVLPEINKQVAGNFTEWAKLNNKKLSMIMRKKPAMVLWTDNFQLFLQAHPAEREELYHSRGLSFHTDQQPELKGVVFILSETGAESILKSGGSSLALQTRSGSQPAMDSLGVHMNTRISFTEEPVQAADVLGYLPGTDLKNEVLVISAHYDHLGTHDGKIYHGADDDGSGTSALLSIASSFSEASKSNNRPRRSILFLSNVGEEKGLLGSQYYSEHPVFAPSNTITDLNIDMIGRIDSAHLKDSNYVYVIGSGKLSSELQKISEQTNKKFSSLTLDYRFDDPKDPNQFYYRSDHYNFAKLNIPIIFYFNGVHADYHQPTDVIEKINFGIYQKRAQLVFYTAWELANRDKRPAVDRVNDFRQ